MTLSKNWTRSNGNQGLSGEKLEDRDGFVSEGLDSHPREGKEGTVEKQHRSRSFIGEKPTALSPKIQSNGEAHHQTPDGSSGKGRNTRDNENGSITSSPIVSPEHQVSSIVVPTEDNTRDDENSSITSSPTVPPEHQTSSIVSQDPHYIAKSTFKVILGWILVISNLILEVLAAIFEQLSSPKHSSFALLAMVTSFTALGVCIIEIVYQCQQGKVKCRKSGKTFWWFYPSNKCFGNFKLTVGLACAFCQWIFAIISYIQYLHHHDNPIKLSALSVVFALGLCGSKFYENRDHVEGDQRAENMLPLPRSIAFTDLEQNLIPTQNRYTAENGSTKEMRDGTLTASDGKQAWNPPTDD